jgi:hypothetical protein
VLQERLEGRSRLCEKIGDHPAEHVIIGLVNVDLVVAV